MNRLLKKTTNSTLRQHRVRARMNGTPERPRLSVHVSHRHITAQVIDDTTGKTLAYKSTVGSKVAAGNLTERAVWVGGEIAKQAKSVKIQQVVFDRGSRLYHGRVKALAEAARNQGLEF